MRSLKHCLILTVTFLLLLLPTLSIAEVPSVPETANPAFWIVESNGKTLYLLSSVHLLPPNLHWTRDEIDNARSRSQVFAFEAPLKDADVSMARFVEANGKLPKGKLLKDVMSPSDYAALEKAAWSVQYPPKLLAPLRPWLAAVYLELYSYLRAGYSPYYGVDHIIEQAAEAKGAEFVYFETVEEQLSYFLNLTGRAEQKYLKATVRDVLDAPDLPADLVRAWASGDTAKLSAMIEKGFDDVPQLKAQLLTARNRKWVPRIVEMLKSDKTHFVTVGAGHLVGRDSVVALLRAKGFKVTGP